MANDTQLAGWRYAGTFCTKCEGEVSAEELVVVNEDGDYDGEGFRDLTTVAHVECPPDDEDAELNDEGGTGAH